ncbi:MAG: AsmA family protein [Phycisphaerales bacterium]|nr:AsmA family protein [Phycisphaerales bacterium]
MKRVLVVVVTLILLVAGGVAFLLFTAPGRQVLSNAAATGAGQDIQNYLARQLVTIVNTYIEPEISFDRLTYEQPGTIHLDGVRFTASDGTEVVRCSRMTVTLSEVPNLNEPLRIASITLDKPELHLVQVTGPDGDNQFKGLLPFVKKENIRNQEAQPEETRLSTILDIAEIRITDALIQHEREGSEHPMTLDHINLSLNTVPDASGDPGWFMLDATVERDPVFNLDLQGRLNIDTFVAEFDGTELDMELGEENYASLPIDLQSLLRQYQARGRFRTALSGRIDLRHPTDANLALAGSLKDFNLTFQKIRTPVEEGTFTVLMKDQVVRIPELAVATSGGSVRITKIEANLAATNIPATATWSIKQVDLDKFFRAQDDGTKLPKIKGILTSAGRISAEVGRLPDSISGDGDLTIREGQLVRIPFVQALTKVMRAVVPTDYKPRDKFDTVFTMDSKGVQMSRLEVETMVAAARGKGTLSYERQMDVLVNAGPMEKVQNMLGAAGDVLGTVTDRVVKYRIYGHVTKPEVQVKPLGM